MDRLGFALAFLILGFALGWILKPDSRSEAENTFANVRQNTTSNSLSDDFVQPGAAEKNNNSVSAKPPTFPSFQESAPTNATHDSQKEIHDSALEKFVWLIANNRYKEAVNYYQDIERRQVGLAPALKRELLKILEVKLNSSEFIGFSNLAEYWLAAYYSDIDVLLLLADYNSLQNYFGEAINLYQLTYSYAANDGELAKIDNKFAAFVHARDARLVENQEWHELQSFYELIEQAAIARPANLYRLAEIYLHNGLPDNARYFLQELVSSGQYKHKAQKLLADIESENYKNKPFRSLGQHTIPLERMGHHFIATLNLQNNVQLKLLLDTGASITSVSHSAFADKIGYVGHSFAPSRLFHTANGVVRGDVLLLPAVYFAGFELRDIELAVVPMPESEQVDGLLGMNVLSQFRFHIDQDAAELVLDKK